MLVLNIFLNIFCNNILTNMNDENVDENSNDSEVKNAKKDTDEKDYKEEVEKLDEGIQEIKLQNNKVIQDNANDLNDTSYYTDNKIISNPIHINNTNQSIESTKFYEHLNHIVKTQENILTMTLMAKEKIKYANQISLDQIKSFKENSFKYGKYLKLIHEELQMTSDVLKKIKKEGK
jgi:hypothetical protein